MRRLLFALLIFTMSSITTCFAQRSTPIIHSIEQLPYFCGARLNVLLSDFGPGHTYLLYRYKIEGMTVRSKIWRSQRVWSDYQRSSTFLFSKAEIANIGSKKLTFQVYEKLGHTDSSIDNIEILPSTVSINVTTRSENPNCDDAAGVAEVIINGGWRYLIFDGTTNTIVNMKTRFLDNLKAFTMEGDVRLKEPVSSLRGLVGVFGIDNVLEFGFRNGRPAAYISFERTSGGEGRFDFNSRFDMPNDGEWHNMVVRSNGSKMQILIDGNEYAAESKPFLRLLPDQPSDPHNLTIGAKVWRQSDRGLKGDISRVTFWNRALTNDELRNLRANPPKGNESGLLAAYNLDIRNETKLFPTLPPGASASRIDECTGIITGAQWSDKVSYELYQKKGSPARNVLVASGNTNSAVVRGLREGTYQFIATYDAGECSEVITTAPFSLISSHNIGAEIAVNDKNNLCEGKELIFNITKTTGGSSTPGVTFKYKWEACTDAVNYVEIPTTTPPSPPVLRHNVPAGRSSYRVHVETSDGSCAANSLPIDVSVNKKISTKPIKRVK
ncbi:MAG: LamG-like jellyroll fold domain-containing protein [Marinifilaceae bacterium]